MKAISDLFILVGSLLLPHFARTFDPAASDIFYVVWNLFWVKHMSTSHPLAAVNLQASRAALLQGELGRQNDTQMGRMDVAAKMGDTELEECPLIGYRS